MKKIKKLFYKSLSLIFVIISTGNSILGQSLLGGTLQFAKSTHLDDINIFYCGKKISTQKHEINLPKITYEISKSSDQTVFYILVYPKDLKVSVKKFPNQEDAQNTIEYLKINSEDSYLFYKLTLVQDEKSYVVGGKQQPSFHWDIVQETLPVSGQVPDDIIQITYFPSFVKAIKGGSQLELPTIYIDNSTIDSFGSEENFEDALIELQLASLDANVLHAPTKRKTKLDNRRLLIMDTLT